MRQKGRFFWLCFHACNFGFRMGVEHAIPMLPIPPNRLPTLRSCRRGCQAGIIALSLTESESRRSVTPRIKYWRRFMDQHLGAGMDLRADESESRFVAYVEGLASVI